MNFLVFGATGRVGSAFVRLAVENGHHITAFIRDPARVTDKGLPVESGLFKPVTGDIYDAELMTDCVRGQDVVICTVGWNHTSGPRVLTATADNVLEAMRTGGVRRLLCVSCSLATMPGEAFAADRLFRRIIRSVKRERLKDLQNQADIIRASRLDWTLVRPLRLQDGPPRGRYTAGAAARGSVPCADVAAFMLKAATEGTFLREAPFLGA